MVSAVTAAKAVKKIESPEQLDQVIALCNELAKEDSEEAAKQFERLTNLQVAMYQPA